MDTHPSSINFFPEHCIVPKSGHIEQHGYFEIGFSRGLKINAHRMAYRMFKGNIPLDMYVMHSCENRVCINPKHLILGSGVDRAKKSVENREERFGVDIPNAKLNPDIVRVIKASSMSSDGLAAIYRVSARCIRDVRNGKTWKQVDAEKESGNV